MAQWKNPPLACVVAGLMYDRVLQLDQLVAEFQGNVRAIFPGYERKRIDISHPTKVAVISIEQERHVFLTVDKRTAVIVGDIGMLIVTSAYPTFEKFSIDFLEPAIDSLDRSVLSGALLINRYGLRYIDRILPSAGQRPEDYVATKLRHDLAADIPGSQGEAMGVSVSRTKMGEGFLDVRFLTGIGRPMIPQDLQPIPIVDDMPSGLNEIDNETRTGIIDTDRFIDVSEPLDVASAMARFARLHEDISGAFAATISSHAKKTWGCNTTIKPRKTKT